jgi:hypothetical protein
LLGLFYFIFLPLKVKHLIVGQLSRFYDIYFIQYTMKLANFVCTKSLTIFFFLPPNDKHINDKRHASNQSYISLKTSSGKTLRRKQKLESFTVVSD